MEFEHLVHSNTQGIKEIADYLKSRNYKKIAVVTGAGKLDCSSAEPNKIKMLRENLAGYADIPDENIFNIPTDPKYSSLLPEVLKKNINNKFCEDFEIIICFNTSAISHIYRRLFEQRLIPGKDIDLIAKCSARLVENIIPSMTHIEVPHFTIGEVLCESVIDEIKNKTSNKVFIEVEPKLIIGESSRK